MKPTETEAREEWRKVLRGLRQRDKDRKPVVARIRDAMAGQPGAQSYDRPRTSGGNTEVWCFTHNGRPPCGETGCDVEVIPSRTDPTGNAAIEQDNAADDLARLRKALTEGGRLLRSGRWPAAWTEASKALAIIAAYSPQAPSSIARRDTAAANIEQCKPCAAILNSQRDAPHFSPPSQRCAQPTTVGGLLTEPEILCDSHLKHLKDHGQPMTREETEALRDSPHTWWRSCPHR